MVKDTEYKESFIDINPTAVEVCGGIKESEVEKVDPQAEHRAKLIEAENLEHARL